MPASKSKVSQYSRDYYLANRDKLKNYQIDYYYQYRKHGIKKPRHLRKAKKHEAITSFLHSFLEFLAGGDFNPPRDPLTQTTVRRIMKLAGLDTKKKSL